MKLDNELIVASSPQVHHRDSTTSIMWIVTLTLLPAGIWGVYIFGIASLITLGVAIGAALLTELIIGLVFKKFTLFDGSAFLTGLLIGYNMPPEIPWFIPAVASFFAIVVVKWTFGGLGSNWMNPALAGRVFVFFSWSGFMNVWSSPQNTAFVNPDAVTTASPMGFIKAGLLEFQDASGPMEFLRLRGYPLSQMDVDITEWLNTNVLSIFNTELSTGYVDLFIGNIPGCIGEVSALLLLVGAIILFARKIITWEIPVVYIASFSLLIWLFDGIRFGGGLGSGDVLYHLFAGGLMLGVFFMATDMVTSPLTGRGMIIYALGCAFFTFLIRVFGSFPEGVSLAIIVMNIFVPIIDKYTGPVRFGVQKGAESNEH